MKKELPVKCVPAEMLERLKGLAKKLWDENNPASVHLSAILEEFDQETRSLGNVAREYETQYLSRLDQTRKGYEEKIAGLERTAADLKARLAGLDEKRAEERGRIGELNTALICKEAELDALKVSVSECEVRLNSQFVSKMQELYDKTSKREMEMFAGWEEKNRELEARSHALESEYADRLKQLKLREYALEDDFKIKKAELVKIIEMASLELDAQEREMDGKEGKPGKRLSD